MSRPTIAQIAQLAGVSKATVSRVVNGNYQYIRESTRERVEAAINELGFRPSSVARSLRSRRTLTAGVLISDIRNPFYPEVIQGVEDVALASGYNVFLCNTNYDIDRGTTFVQLLVDKQVDGALIMSSSTSDVWLEELLANDIPVVILDWEHAPHSNLSVIRVDFRAGIFQIARHLVELGHQHFAHVSGPLDWQTSRDRRDAFLDGLAALEVPTVNVQIIEGDMRIEDGRRAGEALFAGPQRPTAIFAANDLMAMGLLAAARSYGLRVPDDVSIVGLDDIWMAAEVEPPLTTVALPRYQIGQLAMQMLLNRLASGDAGEGRRDEQVQSFAVLRQSTGPARKDEPQT